MMKSQVFLDRFPINLNSPLDIVLPEKDQTDLNELMSKVKSSANLILILSKLVSRRQTYCELATASKEYKNVIVVHVERTDRPDTSSNFP